MGREMPVPGCRAGHTVRSSVSQVTLQVPAVQDPFWMVGMVAHTAPHRPHAMVGPPLPAGSRHWPWQQISLPPVAVVLQARPHDPQLAGSRLTLVSHPLESLRQVRKPFMHRQELGMVDAQMPCPEQGMPLLPKEQRES